MQRVENLEAGHEILGTRKSCCSGAVNGSHGISRDLNLSLARKEANHNFIVCKEYAMKAAGFTIVLILLFAFSQVTGEENSATDGGPVDTGEQDKFEFWMNVKLVESQKLFAALAKADFDTLTKSSQTLKTLNAVEGFVRRGTSGYRTQLRSFEFAVDEIKQQAKKGNIEGATLGFQQLTLSCVNCHKQIRQPVINVPLESVGK
jgi:hypothetical protein